MIYTKRVNTLINNVKTENSSGETERAQEMLIIGLGIKTYNIVVTELVNEFRISICDDIDQLDCGVSVRFIEKT